MTNEQENTFKRRIAQAGIAEYTVLMLELEMEWMKEALEAYNKQDMESFYSSTEKAQSVQLELMNIMNVDNMIARDVYAVFVYINKILIHAKIKKNPLDMERCRDLLLRYHKSFQELIKTDQSGPLMESGEKIYAGLTYGTSGLVENSIGGTEYKI